MKASASRRPSPTPRAAERCSTPSGSGRSKRDCHVVLETPPAPTSRSPPVAACPHLVQRVRRDRANPSSALPPPRGGHAGAGQKSEKKSGRKRPFSDPPQRGHGDRGALAPHLLRRRVGRDAQELEDQRSGDALPVLPVILLEVSDALARCLRGCEAATSFVVLPALVRRACDISLTVASCPTGYPGVVRSRVAKPFVGGELS